MHWNSSWNVNKFKKRLLTLWNKNDKTEYFSKFLFRHYHNTHFYVLGYLRRPESSLLVASVKKISGSSTWLQPQRKEKPHCLTGWSNPLSAQSAGKPSEILQFTSVKRDMLCAKLAGNLWKLRANPVQCVVENLLIPEIWQRRTCWSSYSSCPRQA